MDQEEADALVEAEGVLLRERRQAEAEEELRRLEREKQERLRKREAKQQGWGWAVSSVGLGGLFFSGSSPAEETEAVPKDAATWKQYRHMGAGLSKLPKCIHQE